MRQFSFGGRLAVSHIHALLTAAGHSSLSSAVAYEDSSALVIFYFILHHIRPKSGLFFLHIEGCMKFTCLQT